MPKRTIFIDSRKRDVALYPSASQYVAEIDEVAKNVESVELVLAIYPRTGTDFVVNLDVRELNSRMLTNCKAISTCFTQLPMTQAVNEYTGSDYRSLREFRVPLEKMSKLSITWSDVEGTLYPMGDHVLRFEVVTSERNSVIDTGYVEGIADPTRSGASFFGLGTVYTPTVLYNAYMKKRRSYISEQRTASEISRLDSLYKSLLSACQN